MGAFDFITDLFSKPKKGAQKKTVKKKKRPATAAAKKATPGKKTAVQKKKKKSASPLDLSVDAAKIKKKKRKKSSQVSADPINEESLGFSISLKGEDEQSKKRNAIRIRVDGLVARIPRLKGDFAVTDISATGLGFDFEKPRIKGGVQLKMELVLNGRVKVPNLHCKVMRHARGSVGCVFLDLDRSQDDTIHEIVLLGQKQQAARRAAKKDAEFQLPD